ncbi:bifunctional 2-polyprenyl-6-hydroxyphenol methylase/3-demethylubiquinol 3-O-methyltransferase UbiG [Streptomyces sp. NBC_00038]|uniref:class I SAM-dependent methyltransferase n=1 Tax=Streptomyces sp. NBC_00038 TaxID=2903615 RepID=UPI00225B5218|nr:class I SAM-dependent methyltransferase [Streptomyces sp. NBC_00038]MCX5555470.1 class I SAM-dependent methyltransferase [Streptomyces sp. NBC_00038]
MTEMDAGHGNGREQEHERMMRANQANWDARTPVHLASRFYGLQEKLDPARWFAAFEWEDLGELSGLDVLHLQCHLGTETIAFAERGARAVGLDISEASVAAAAGIAAQAGADVAYVRANVYDAVEALGERRFDVVYTGKGALCYLPDLDRWATTIAQLLRPEGRLYIAEFHPLLNSLGPKPAPDEGGELLLRHDYLGGRNAVHRDATYTYTDGPAVRGATDSYEWMHGLDDVINALIGAGLRIRRLRESDELPWPRWPQMIRTPSGWWRLPETEPRIPLLYGLLAGR